MKRCQALIINLNHSAVAILADKVRICFHCLQRQKRAMAWTRGDISAELIPKFSLPGCHHWQNSNGSSSCPWLCDKFHVLAKNCSLLGYLCRFSNNLLLLRSLETPCVKKNWDAPPLKPAHSEVTSFHFWHGQESSDCSATLPDIYSGFALVFLCCKQRAMN